MIALIDWQNYRDTHTSDAISWPVTVIASANSEAPRPEGQVEEFDLIGSMSTPVKRYHNMQAESFIKTVKIEDIYLAKI